MFGYSHASVSVTQSVCDDSCVCVFGSYSLTGEGPGYIDMTFVWAFLPSVISSLLCLHVSAPFFLFQIDFFFETQLSCDRGK